MFVLISLEMTLEPPLGCEWTRLGVQDSMVIKGADWDSINVASFENDDFVLALLQVLGADVERDLRASAPVLANVLAIDPADSALEARRVEVSVSWLINVEIAPVKGWLVDWKSALCELEVGWSAREWDGLVSPALDLMRANGNLAPEALEVHVQVVAEVETAKVLAEDLQLVARLDRQAL